MGDSKSAVQLYALCERMVQLSKDGVGAYVLII